MIDNSSFTLIKELLTEFKIEISNMQNALMHEIKKMRHCIAENKCKTIKKDL